MAPPNLARTLPAALAAAMSGDAARPFITWVGAGGARTELSVRTYENNVAKAANLLQDDAGVSDGSRVVLHLPPHSSSRPPRHRCRCFRRPPNLRRLYHRHSPFRQRIRLRA